MSTFYDLPLQGETVTLFTHLAIRDDAHVLYGFASESERALFRSLLKVNGVGAKMALAILSGMSADEFAHCIQANDTAALVRRERERGIGSDRIVVAGFSQGGAIALQLAIRYPEKLAGLIALSTYMLLDHRLDNDRHEANKDLPLFVGHGRSDPMVPFMLGEQLAERMRGLGHPVEWHSYPMLHAVCPEEIADISAWLRNTLG